MGERKVTRRIVRVVAEHLFIALLLISSVSAYEVLNSPPQHSVDQTQSDTLIDTPKIDVVENQTVTTFVVPIENNSAKTPDENHNAREYNRPAIEKETQSQLVSNETILLSVIDALRATGGHIVLENNITIMDNDVLLPSNIELSGANPQITISFAGKNLQVASKAQNVTLKDLTIDASNLGERYGFVIGQNASNISVDNIAFRNYFAREACLLNMGNNVTINNTSFTNVTQAYPIQINGSDANVTNSNSNDNSIYSLVNVGGGLYDINVINNSAINRPLFYANYGATPTKNMLIENNIMYFPNSTYGILVRGGMGDYLPVSDENVIVRGNSIQAATGAWNAIAIYGLTCNVLVENNTVDMSQSGHNGIGVSSGINVTVTSNNVFGSTESTEGGIEVESNPVHNRAVGISENVTVTKNTVYNSTWGIYVRVMDPNNANWNGTILRSKNIVIENNTVYACGVGVNLLYGENLIVRYNEITANTVTFKVDTLNVFNYTVKDNIGFP